MFVKRVGVWWLSFIATTAAAATGVSPDVDTASFNDKNWQQTLSYLLQRLPQCEVYPGTTSVAVAIDDRLTLEFPQINYGTTESLPLSKPFTAEARSNGDRWRLFVRFRRDLVRVDMPYIHGHATYDEFHCDTDQATATALAGGFTRLELLREQERAQDAVLEDHGG